MGDSGHLGVEEGYSPRVVERREDGDEEEHYSETPYPLDDGAPEEQAVAEGFYVGDYGGPGGGES